MWECARSPSIAACVMAAIPPPGGWGQGTRRAAVGWYGGRAAAGHHAGRTWADTPWGEVDPWPHVITQIISEAAYRQCVGVSAFRTLPPLPPGARVGGMPAREGRRRHLLPPGRPPGWPTTRQQQVGLHGAAAWSATRSTRGEPRNRQAVRAFGNLLLLSSSGSATGRRNTVDPPAGTCGCCPGSYRRSPRSGQLPRGAEMSAETALPGGGGVADGCSRCRSSLESPESLHRGAHRQPSGITVAGFRRQEGAEGRLGVTDLCSWLRRAGLLTTSSWSRP